MEAAMFKLRQPSKSSSSPLYSLHRRGRGRLRVEELEARCLLSAFAPAQLRHAYGFDQISFSSNGQTMVGDGSGQTIAIVDAYDDPNIASDLKVFDSAYGLVDPTFTKVSPSGVLPRANAGWAQEIALDVEWAHAIAPGADILLVEAASDSLSALLNAVSYAARQPGVSVVSMSWGSSEFANQINLDSIFTTPANHNGVTFVASSGDTGSRSGVSWPASSANVLSVGGTTLHVLDNSGTYASESAWSGSTGGYSTFESEPTWQLSIQDSGVRTAPDVSYVADPNTGVEVYDSYALGRQAGWFSLGGTSAGAPQWAALIAIADQGLALAGESTLDGASQTLPALYSLAQASPSVYFNEITHGSNGYPALAGYNLVTGLCTPKADALINALVTGGGGISIAVASPTIVTGARSPGSPVALPPRSPRSGAPESGNVTVSAGTSASAALVLLSEHNFVATAAGIAGPSNTAVSGTPSQPVTDPSVIPQVSTSRPSAVRIESGGGDNALLPADQDDDAQPMDQVPDLPGSGTAPRMTPAAPIPPAASPGPSSGQEGPAPLPQDDYDILFDEGERVASLSEQTAELSLDEGTFLKTLAAAMGLWIVLDGWGRRAATRVKATSELITILDERANQGARLR
jgi:subtilase family serine protease